MRNLFGLLAVACLCSVICTPALATTQAEADAASIEANALKWDAYAVYEECEDEVITKTYADWQNLEMQIMADMTITEQQRQQLLDMIMAAQVLYVEREDFLNNAGITDWTFGVDLISDGDTDYNAQNWSGAVANYDAASNAFTVYINEYGPQVDEWYGNDDRYQAVANLWASF